MSSEVLQSCEVGDNALAVLCVNKLEVGVAGERVKGRNRVKVIGKVSAPLRHAEHQNKTVFAVICSKRVLEIPVVHFRDQELHASVPGLVACLLRGDGKHSVERVEHVGSVSFSGDKNSRVLHSGCLPALLDPDVVEGEGDGGPCAPIRHDKGELAGCLVKLHVAGAQELLTFLLVGERGHLGCSASGALLSESLGEELARDAGAGRVGLGHLESCLAACSAAWLDL